MAIAGLRNAELEKAIIASPDDRTLRELYADWLQGRGDPRGELMSLQLALESQKTTGVRRRIQELLGEAREALLGEFGDWIDSIDGANASSVEWRAGFVDAVVMVVETAGDAIDVVERLCGHACGALLRRLEVRVLNLPQGAAATLYARIAELAPATLAELAFTAPGVPEDNLGALDPLFTRGSLRTLTLVGAGPSATGVVPLTTLRLGLFGEPLFWLGESQWPALAELDVDFERWRSDDVQRELLRPVLAPARFPALRTLRLRSCLDTDAVCEASERLLPQLTVLDLSGGTLGRLGVEVLETSLAGRRLERLVVTGNELGPDEVRRLSRLCVRLEVGEPGAVLPDSASSEGVVLVLDREVDDESLVRAALQLARHAEVPDLLLHVHRQPLGGRPVTLVEIATGDARFSMDTLAESLARRGAALPRPERFRVLQLGWSQVRDRSAWRLIVGEEVAGAEAGSYSEDVAAHGLEMLLGGPVQAPALLRVASTQGRRIVVRFNRKDRPPEAALADYRLTAPLAATMEALAPRPATHERPGVSRAETCSCGAVITSDETCPDCGMALCDDCADLEGKCANCATEEYGQED